MIYSPPCAMQASGIEEATMKLTRAADYGIRVMIHLAALAPRTRISRADLASASNCPEQFLSKVLQSLTHAGLIISHRGNTGGFELAPVHRAATMLDVIESVEGPLRLNICLSGEGECRRKEWCPAYGVCNEAQKALSGVLRGAHIGDLARIAAQNRGLAREIQQSKVN
jgi:Rrf2 family protein